jgi:Fe2+ or Zn2+ uptake regulation protein
MLKRSKQKEVILRIMKSTTSHPTADWVYAQARKEIPNISLATVYRDLKLLKDSGELLELDLGQGPSHYNGDTTDHYHFRCERCGQLFDLEEPVDTTVDERVARKAGHDVTHHVLEFRGICKDCRK